MLIDFENAFYTISWQFFFSSYSYALMSQPIDIFWKEILAS